MHACAQRLPARHPPFAILQGAHRRLAQIGASAAAAPAASATDATGDDTGTSNEDDATESEFGLIDGVGTPVANPSSEANSSVTGACSIAVTINYACAAKDPTGACAAFAGRSESTTADDHKLRMRPGCVRQAPALLCA